MENSAKVFSSDITRVGSTHKNNLYDLLNIIPAIPLKLNDVKSNACDYSPKTDKIYIPKKKSRLKVKTVRDIKKAFEQDIYTHLTTDLEMQQNILFKKIRRGSSKDDSTKKIASKILKGDTPISRSTWQMLINLNPEHHKHPRQFVLWNGKYIQVNGSFGGIKKNICNYDLASKPQCLPLHNHKIKCLRYHEGNKKKKLLRNSLAVKFKPGPLCKKQNLDNSHQKYHVGNIELISLPKPGLDVQPKYGTAFESSLSHFLNNLRKDDGTISRKWAEFAVSVLGTFEKSKPVQLNRDCISFDLAYKYNQNRLLMRRNVDSYFNTSEVIGTDTLYIKSQATDINVQCEIKDMVNKIIDAVEINLIQDKLFTQEEDLKSFPSEHLKSVNTITHVKDKSKRKFGELGRLDVTVITLPETEERNLTRNCGKMHCKFGCICASIEGTYILKQHCGRVECMFTCNCDFLKDKSGLSYTGCTDLFPGLLNMDNEMNLNLSKEEQKFHQTVIVTGEKRILLKGDKRNGKIPKKFEDFYNNMSLKHENQKNLNLSIVLFKLKCDNIEPWCMVHKLYKCFCKGKFTETCISVSSETVGKELLSKDSTANVDNLKENSEVTNDISCIEECERQERSAKKAKISANLQTKPNKIHTSRRMDKTMTHTDDITKPLNYTDPENEIKINRISVNDEGNALSGSSVSEIINLNSEKGMLTRHAIRKLIGQQNSNSNKNQENKSDSEGSDYLDSWDSKSMSSSRTSAYAGRKYSNGYYKNTNDKILTMEKNDKRIRERLAFLYSKCCEEDTIINPTKRTKDQATSLLELLCDANRNSEDLIPQSKRKRLSNETKLVSWLESNYKMYKQRNDHGLFKNALEPPQHGKVALHSWDFILKRYRDRKNLFLVSRQKPFRIFMAVNTENSFFDNCIDINDIRFADLHKYPQTVKNLLINATDLKDNFCILRGLPCCWELIGSVTKVSESDEQGADNEDKSEMNVESSDMDTLALFDQNDSVARKPIVETTKQNTIETLDTVNQSNSEANNLLLENTEHKDSDTLAAFNNNSEIRNPLVENTEQQQDKICVLTDSNLPVIKSLLENTEQKDIQSITEKQLESNTGCSEDTGSSKWFVMTIENDFTEIRFFRKGFFVKYGSIINAISVARLSGKTVRLSSKKCIEQPEAPQFGIYAIPNDNEYCVFVGPYEMEDTLGIETIKTILDVRRLKRTRGFWITTSKVDNLKVVENPLSFVPLTNSRINSALIPLETHVFSNDEVNRDQQEKPDMQESLINKIEESKECSPSKKDQIKIVRPIKIRKTNGFYHLASDGVLKKISLQYPHNTPPTMPVALKTCLNLKDMGAKSLITPKSVTNDLSLNSIPETSQEPCAEAASSSAVSQIKIAAVFSTQNDDPADIAKRTNHEKGMFILKPEEINRKLVQNRLTETTPSSKDGHNINNKTINVRLLQLKLVPENVITTKQTGWRPLNDDIFEISDDESCKTNGTSENSNIWTNVWIECTSIPKLGWIAGLKNLNNLLSFKFPGCEYSDFYSKEEAFTKINLELRKKINKLNNVELQWRIMESIEELQGQEMNLEKFNADYVDLLDDNNDNNRIQDDQH